MPGGKRDGLPRSRQRQRPLRYAGLLHEPEHAAGRCQVDHERGVAAVEIVIRVKRDGAD